MAELNGDIAKRISLILVYICSADAASLYFYQNFIFIDFRNRKFSDINFPFPCQYCNLCCLWNITHKNTILSPSVFLLFNLYFYCKIPLLPIQVTYPRKCYISYTLRQMLKMLHLSQYVTLQVFQQFI